MISKWWSGFLVQRDPGKARFSHSHCSFELPLLKSVTGARTSSSKHRDRRGDIHFSPMETHRCAGAHTVYPRTSPSSRPASRWKDPWLSHRMAKGSSITPADWRPGCETRIVAKAIRPGHGCVFFIRQDSRPFGVTGRSFVPTVPPLDSQVRVLLGDVRPWEVAGVDFVVLVVREPVM